MDIGLFGPIGLVGWNSGGSNGMSINASNTVFSRQRRSRWYGTPGDLIHGNSMTKKPSSAGKTDAGRYLQVIYLIDEDDALFVIHAMPLTGRRKRNFRRSQP